MSTISELSVGDSVTVAPTHWLALAGAPSGVVVKVGRTKAHLRADVNGCTYTVSPSALTVVSP